MLNFKLFYFKFDNKYIDLIEIVWLVDQITSIHEHVNIDIDLYIWLLKQIRGGDLGTENIWMVNAMLKLFASHKYS
jgi:hypothetical protein